MTIAKKIVKAVSTILVVLAVVAALAFAGVRLLGFEVYTVLSGSMEPTYHTGAVIWVKPCNPEEVQVGDPITFVMNEDLVVATHRVVAIDTENGSFTTKGDANEAEDGAPVLYENLIGVPVASVPVLGYFVSYVQNPLGRYIAIAVVALLILLVFLPDMLFKDEEEESQGKRSVQRPSSTRTMQGARSMQSAQGAYVARSPQGTRSAYRAQGTRNTRGAQTCSAQSARSTHESRERGDTDTPPRGKHAR